MDVCCGETLIWGHQPPLGSHATSLVVRQALCQDGEVRSINKRWGGRTGAERRAERRQQLIEAATEIWSESGWAAVTMRGVCARTGLNDRYFYEGFKTRDELLVAAWDGVRNDMLGEVAALAIWMSWKCALAGLPYGNAGFPQPGDPGPADRGTYFFYAGSASTATATTSGNAWVIGRPT
mgnify:CR=1 FL=1